MKITLGEAIAQHRKEKHLTQTQLAQRYGISDKAVSKWERNLSKPNEVHLCDLVAFLGLPREYLPEDNTDNTHKSSFWDMVRGEMVRIVSVSIVLASLICLWHGSLSVESAVYLIGASCAILGWITMIKG